MSNLTGQSLALLSMEEGITELQADINDLKADIEALGGNKPGDGKLDMSWEEDEEKKINNLPFHDKIKDPLIWESDKDVNGIFVTRTQYIHALEEMLLRDMENAEKYIDTIKDSVLITSVAQIFSSEDKMKYSPNAIKAAYLAFQELAQYRIPLSDKEPNLALIIKVLEAFEEVMYRSEYMIEYVLNALFRIVIARKNEEITKHVNDFYGTFIDKYQNYGVDDDGLQDYRTRIKVFNSLNEATQKKEITPIIEMAQYFSAKLESVKLNEFIITWMSGTILDVKEFAPNADQVISTIALAVDYFPDEKKPDVIETVCYLSTQLASEQTVPLIVSTLNMLAMQNGGKKELEKSVEGIKDTLKTLASKHPEQDVRIFQMLMSIDGKSPEDQMTEVCKALATPPSDKERGYNTVEARKQKELLHTADHLMQQSAKTVQIYIDKISGLKEDDAPFVKLVAEDILQMFFKILGAVETYSNFNKAPDDVKNKVRDEVMPQFMSKFNVQITKAFVNIITDKLAANNIDKLPMPSIDLILNIIKTNITTEGNKTYLPYLKVLTSQMDTDVLEVRQKCYEVILDVVRFMWKSCNTEMLCQFVEQLNDWTHYPYEMLRLLVKSIMCEEVDGCKDKIGMSNVDFICHRMFSVIYRLVCECDNQLFLTQAQEQAKLVRDHAFVRFPSTWILADSLVRGDLDEYIEVKNPHAGFDSEDYSYEAPADDRNSEKSKPETAKKKSTDDSLEDDLTM